MEQNKKLFAFKLVDKQVANASKWKAREGVALAGCTLIDGQQGRGYYPPLPLQGTDVTDYPC